MGFGPFGETLHDLEEEVPVAVAVSCASWADRTTAAMLRSAAVFGSGGQIRRANRLLTDDDIRALITALDNLRDVIRDAGPAEKAASYDQFDLKVTFKPGEAKIRAEVTIGPENYVEHAEQCGDTGRVRAGTDPIPSPYPPHCSMCYSADVDLQQTGRPYAS